VHRAAIHDERRAHAGSAVVVSYLLGKLLTTIDGIGDNTAARMIASIDFSAFKSAAAYVGVAPLVNHSSLRSSGGAKRGEINREGSDPMFSVARRHGISQRARRLRAITSAASSGSSEANA
jgi:transposase